MNTNLTDVVKELTNLCTEHENALAVLADTAYKSGLKNGVLIGAGCAVLCLKGKEIVGGCIKKIKSVKKED